jgi:pimeloyl-ACP methyl ester carboxylesterase
VNRKTVILGAAAGVAAGYLAARALRRDSLPELPGEEIRPDTPGHRGGSGEPLLLLHGITVTWRTWKPVLPLLEKQYDVIAPTLLGHSGAAPLADGVPASQEALVDGVEAELDSLGLDRVHIAGNSLGGWISLELARRGRARSVTVFSPAGAFTSNLRLATLTTGIRVGLDTADALGPRLEAVARKPWGKRLLLAQQVAHPQRFPTEDLVADIRALRNVPVVRPLLGVLGDKPLQPLPDPGCPVRVVWARHDRVIPYGVYGEPLLRQLPTAELLFLDDVGHVPMSDDPDAVARLIMENIAKADHEAA